MKTSINIITTLLLLFLNTLQPIASKEFCKCGNFIEINLKNESFTNNLFDLNLQPFEEILNRDDVNGRRLYVIGNYGETQILNGIILDELYHNYQSARNPDCLVEASNSSCLINLECQPNYKASPIQLWNDVFLYETANTRVAMIYISFQSTSKQSAYSRMILSAFSSFISTIYINLNDKSDFDESFGNMSQQCDFTFHIDENDTRNEIDESTLELHGILSHQNIEMHESEHFTKENLSVEKFLETLKFANEKIQQENTIDRVKLQDFYSLIFEQLKKMKKFDSAEVQSLYNNLMNFANEYKQEVSEEIEKSKNETNELHLKDSKLQRKVKFFRNKLTNIKQMFSNKINRLVDLYQEYSADDVNYISGKIISDVNGFILKISQNILFDLPYVDAENYLRILKNLFATSHCEITKSEAFKKQIERKKIFIPLPCDIKC